MTKSQKILITGVAGFLGSHLAEKLAKMGNHVVGIDNMQGGYADNVPKNIEKRNHFQNFEIQKSMGIFNFHLPSVAFSGR